MNELKVKVDARLSTIFLDHLIMSMIAVAFSIPGMIIGLSDAFDVSHNDTDADLFSGLHYVGLIGFAVYICKDCINGRSIAKRILKLQVVDYKTGQVASPIKCFIRNIFCILWPVEVIVALINPSRRIGDWVAGTKLVPYNPAIEQPKPDFAQIAAAFGFAYGMIVLAMIPFNTLKVKTGLQGASFVESSYNEQESRQTEKLFADSLSQYLTSEVKVYDKIEGENLKYVSVIFTLNKNYLEDDKSYGELQSKTIPLLLAKFPEKTFVGKVKYVYQSSNKMQSNILPLDWRLKK
jgi:uncharacterized RDD family membrane protein YckC